MNETDFIENSVQLKTVKKEFFAILKREDLVNLIKFIFITILISWVSFAVSYNFLPPQIPIFFSKPWGYPQIADKIYFLIYPLSMSLLFFINLRIASILIKISYLMSAILLWSQLLISIMSLIAIFKIIYLLV